MSGSECPKCGRSAEKVHASDCPFNPKNMKKEWNEGESALIEVKLVSFSSDAGWVWVGSPHANGSMCVQIDKLRRP